MYLHGSFLTRHSAKVDVHIVTGGSRTPEVVIGADGGTVDFGADPASIDSCVNDTFDHLLRSQAAIRLLTRDFIPDLFCTSCRDAVVNIFRDGECVFAGFIEPQAYSQGYNALYDELEISCIDVLSALQYSPYRDIGTPRTVSYDRWRTMAAQRTFGDIILDMIVGAGGALDLTGGDGPEVWYDGSKALSATPADRYDIFSRLSVSELLFMGDTEDDVWKQDRVLEALMKYLNLHIVQDGLRFYIFSWESVKDGAVIAWHDLLGGGAKTPARPTVEFSLHNVASDDTTVSIGEVFNRIQLTCRPESVDSVIESPLDDDALTSPYTNRQKYLTEYSVDGEGVTAQEVFYYLCHDKPVDNGGATVTDWYVRVKDNPSWTFPEPGTGDSLVDKYCAGGTNQHTLPDRLRQAPCAALLSLGKVETKMDHKDNSPVASIDMTDYLVVSVNGNGKDDMASTFPTESSLRQAAPCAVYSGATSGGVFSPSDDTTTNYIVISGRIILNPLTEMTNTFKALHDLDPWTYLNRDIWDHTVPSRTNADGRFYTLRYYKASVPSATPQWDTAKDYGLVPFTGTGPEQYEFSHSAVGDSTDSISKVAVLACMLVIGDKCVVETGTDGKPSDFEWRTFKPLEECASIDEYYSQCFTIGFDPKIGDKLIGTEFDIQNNIDFTMGIDASGMAIPVKADTPVSGPVRFEILGPVNTLWNDIVRRHPTWFRHTTWSDNSIPLLAHMSSIFVKSFEVKIYSDNGLTDTPADSDLVYMSDTSEDFVNIKDGIEFDIVSALNADERRQLGVSDAASLSTPLDTTTGLGLLTVYDHNKGEQAKPEQLYVDSYYTECHKPRIIMTQKIEDTATAAGRFNRFRHPAMPDRLFYVQGISRNLIEGYAELTIKEVWND